VLLLLIAVASGLGTALPQGEGADFYRATYGTRPWLGLLDGAAILRLQLDHVYSSGWFLALLAWLGLALILCSWRRQWPALRGAMRWIDYRQPRQLSKLTLAESIPTPAPQALLPALRDELQRRGWSVQLKSDRLAARSGLMGRVGPLLVHSGLVILMVGAVWGVLAGQRLERFLAPGRDLELLDRSGEPQLTILLDAFRIERDPAGRPEQFRSRLVLRDEHGSLARDISVNHPLRYRGMTLYQADWSLAAISLRIGGSPALELPLRTLDQLGDQVWGLALPTRPDGTEPVLLTLSSEQGPVQVFDASGRSLATLSPGGAAVTVRGVPLRVESVLPASGLLLKRDPGVPLVYVGFAVALLGGALSLVSTRQLWAVAEPGGGALHIGALCNRNLPALAREMPMLAESIRRAPSAQQA
jgi:cytochrome c biogenesis protein